MTVLAVVQRVARVVGVDVPTACFGVDEREKVELAETANIAAETIAKAYEWETLKTLQTMTGDGSTKAFALPSDYDRMPKDQRIWSTSIETPLLHVTSTDKWLELDIRSFDFVVGAWTKYGGQIHIKPALASGASAKYFYLSNAIVAPASGANKSSFTADDDTFRLSERVLRLAMVWLWKANKGLPYAEDLATYEEALSNEIAADKGPKVLKIGRPRMPSDASVAYPRAITP